MSKFGSLPARTQVRQQDRFIRMRPSVSVFGRPRLWRLWPCRRPASTRRAMRARGDSRCGAF